MCVSNSFGKKRWQVIAYSQMSTDCDKGAQPTLVSSVSCLYGDTSFPVLFTLRVDVSELCPEQGVHMSDHLVSPSLSPPSALHYTQN